jgi:phosphoglycerol geranylgeranyltransferase
MGRVAARVLPVDTNPVPASWTHLTKVDPEARRRLPLLYPRYLSFTDAVAVGGSTAVTGANTEATFALLSLVDVPVFHEPSHPTHVTDYTREVAAFIAIPQVLNGSVEAVVGELGAGIERVRDDLAPSLVADRVPAWTPAFVRRMLADAATSWLLETAAFEAYLVQNPDSAAAREAGVGPDDVLEPGEAARRAMVADRYLHCPVVYVEYSGTFGSSEAEQLLAAVSGAVSGSRVWYGGGLSSAEDARAMLDAGADAVVVGNAFHAVAREEEVLFTRARDALAPGASQARIESWLAAEVPVEETAAAAYLSTVPSLSDPTVAAERLLVDTLHVWSRLRALSGRPSRAALDRVIAVAGIDSESDTDADPDVDAVPDAAVDTGRTDPTERWVRTALDATRGRETVLSTHLSPLSPDSADSIDADR